MEGADVRDCQGGDEGGTEAYNKVRRGAPEESNEGRREERHPPKKHPCPDCSYCQWCSDDRCALCLKKCSCRKKLSMAEQIRLYEELNRQGKPELQPGESIDELRDYHLQIIQPTDGYRFSLDPLLLTGFAPSGRTRLLDIGTGCGVIPLVMARKYPAISAVGVEIQPLMAGIAGRNATNNGLSDRVTIVGADIMGINGQFPSESFDLVMGNPPYRVAGSGRISPVQGRDIARHESSARLADFMAIAKKMLQPGGSICFIYHPDRLVELLHRAHELKLSPLRLQMVHGSAGQSARMFMIELVKGRKVALDLMPPLFVNETPYGSHQNLLK